MVYCMQKKSETEYYKFVIRDRHDQWFCYDRSKRVSYWSDTPGDVNLFMVGRFMACIVVLLFLFRVKMEKWKL